MSRVCKTLHIWSRVNIKQGSSENVNKISGKSLGVLWIKPSSRTFSIRISKVLSFDMVHD